MKIGEKFILFIVLSIMIALFSVSGVNAALCRYSDGYMRSCSGASVTNPQGYSLGYSYTASMGYNPGTYQQVYNQNYNYNKNYHHSYYTAPKTDYYKATYAMTYENDYTQGYYGYEKFTHNPHGYEHEYDYGTYGYQKTDYSSSYEVKRRY